MTYTKGTMRLHRLLQIYYLATPLFFLGDQFAGVSVRIAGLDAFPVLKYGYYAGCMGIGAATFLFPKATNPLSLVECVANILVLILGIMLPILQAPDAIMEGKEVVLAGPEQLANFLISGSVLTVSFYRNPLVGGIQGGGAHDLEPPQ